MNKDFEQIKNMSKEDLEYAYYGAKVKYKDYKQALNRIREYINTKKITKDGVFLVKESTFGQDILKIINETIGDDESENK